jgi:uncharacterized protein YdeI (YjbR/CyaY-like superfamily)
MSHRDPRVDAYIAKAAPFAQPILEHARAVVHEACPDAEETIKWGMPTFVHAGAILCGMAAFKAHASFGFWKHALVVGEDEGGERVGMGSFGRLASVRDLPPKKQLVAYVKKAAAINEAAAGKRKGATSRQAAASRAAVAASAAPARKPPPVPTPEFAAALRRNKAAAATFKAFPPSHQREYVEWIAGAKREETRDRRIAQAVEWLAEGRQRNWKYM